MTLVLPRRQDPRPQRATLRFLEDRRHRARNGHADGDRVGRIALDDRLGRSVRHREGGSTDGEVARDKRREADGETEEEECDRTEEFRARRPPLPSDPQENERQEEQDRRAHEDARAEEDAGEDPFARASAVARSQ